MNRAVLPLTAVALVGVLAAGWLVVSPALRPAPEPLHYATTPVAASTLAGHPGLYYLDAGNLTGTLDDARFSAYSNLESDGKIAPGSTFITDHNLTDNLPHLPHGTVTGIKAGLGLAGGGTSGTVTISLVPGLGLYLSQNGTLNTLVGDSVDLASEVINVLPITNGGTGLATAPAAGQILVGNGKTYDLTLLTAGDGLTLAAAPGSMTYAVNTTVCRTSGNCAGAGGGIVGSGSTGYLPKFTAIGTVADSLLFDNGTNVGIGTASPAAPLDISSSAFLQLQTTRPDATGTSVWQQNLYSSSAFGPTFGTQMASGTVAAPGALRSGVHYLELAGNGYDGLAFTRGAHLYFTTAENWTTSAHGTNIEFYTTPDGTTRPVRGLLIANNGSVGIGTVSPLSKLDVPGGVAIGSYAGVTAAPANSLIVSGSVGIGTNNPGYALDVVANGNTAVRFGGTTDTGVYVSRVADSDYILGFNSIYNGSTTIAKNSAAGQLEFYSGGVQLTFDTGLTPGASYTRTPRLFITPSGKMGLGTTTPQSALDVVGGAAIGAYAGVTAAPSDGLIVSGNLGLGTTTPSQKLEIATGNLRFDTLGHPTAPTVAVGAAGVLTGTYQYLVTYLTPAGETDGGTASSVVAPSSQQVNVTNIPVDATGVATARKLYRTTAGGTSYFLLTTLNDNTTTTYTDNTPDGSLTTKAPSDNTSGGRVFVNSNQVMLTGNNTGLGFNVLAANAGGTYNAGLGYDALYHNTTGTENVAIGYAALFQNTTGSANTAMGYNTLSSNTNGQNNTAIGLYALQRNTTGDQNTSVGMYSMSLGATGSYNTGLGYYALQNTTGIDNVGLGAQALVANTTGNYNIAIGHAAGANTLGSNNVFIGEGAGQSNTGSGNLFVGYNAGKNETGSNKLYIANSSTASPLLYGDFSAETLVVNGTLTATGGLAVGNGGTPITRMLSATTTWDPPSTATGTATSTTVTVTGAAVGDVVTVGFAQPLPDGVLISGSVAAASTVKVTIGNLSGGAVDLASGTLRVAVSQY